MACEFFCIKRQNYEQEPTRIPCDIVNIQFRVKLCSFTLFTKILFQIQQNIFLN